MTFDTDEFEMTPEITWQVLHAAHLIGDIQSRGYLAGGAFTVNMDQVRGDLTLHEIEYGLESPNKVASVVLAIRMMKASVSEDNWSESEGLKIAELLLMAQGWGDDDEVDIPRGTPEERAAFDQRRAEEDAD